MKCCVSCEELKSLKEFYRDKVRKDGLHPYCKTCHSKKWKNRPKDKAFKKRIRRNTRKHALKQYGMTPEGFKNLSESQGNVCAICKEPELKQVLSVDHCHKTGKVRGLLCNRCNTSIGKFGDNPILLQKAVDYLCQSQ